jgi:ABC-type multidrug transport system fused ATPase/permease subunit
MAEEIAKPSRSDMGPTYRRIWQFMGEFRSKIVAAIGTSFLASIAFSLLPWPIRYLIDDVLLGNKLRLGFFGVHATTTNAQKIRVGTALAGGFLVIQIVAALLMSLSFYLFAGVALRMIHSLRGRMLRHLRTLSLGFHANRSSGEMIFRSINDARSIQEVMIFGVQAWIMPVFQIVLMVILMAWLDWLLTLVAVSVAPLLLWTIRRLTSRIQATSQESRGHLGKLTALIEQTLGSMRAVQVFGKDAKERDRFDETSNKFIAAQLKFRLAEQTLSVATMLITGIATSAVLLVAVYRVIHGHVSVGALWIFLSYMERIYELLQRNLATFGMLQDSVVGVSRAFAVLDTPPSITDAADAFPISSFERSIDFREVALTYDTATVLDNVSFTVERGRTIALVGATGSGKTSILNLVPRLYDVTKGSVLIDDHDVRSLQLASLRDLVSVLPQEPLLFAGTIRENIAYGRLDATEDELVAAAKAAHAHEFVDALPEKYSTDVGDRGAKLSIGQQQRVALARAYLKDAPILLLDEPTAALDLRTEADLLESLQHLMHGRTVMIVAHRLSTIRNADCIHVLDQGRIVESGTHDELLAQNTAYALLWNAAQGANGHSGPRFETQS